MEAKNVTLRQPIETMRTASAIQLDEGLRLVRGVSLENPVGVDRAQPLFHSTDLR